jgi:2-methylisocitrate lyase-like PEP mutase family enzyme
MGEEERMAPTRGDLATGFHQLHRPGHVLVLPNAWDAGSARLIASHGAEAIATTSSGVAWAHGHPDGQAISFAEVVEVVARIARAVRIPVSADVEEGYATDPETVGENVAAVIGAGAVGINLEDGNQTSDATAAKIAAARAAADREGVDLFINARTDTYLRRLVPPERAVQETLVRAARYRDAGASGLFVPRLHAPDEIREIAEAVSLPLNVLMVPGLAPIQELGALGVRRVSAGGGLARAAYAAAGESAERLLSTGSYDVMFTRGGSLDLNRLLAGG